jgi:hypothetical protein
MGLSVRFLVAASALVTHPSGHSYRADSAGIVDIPIQFAQQIVNYQPGSPDADPSGQHLAKRLMVVGATADRPVNDPGRGDWPPAAMYDTTLASPIFLVPYSNPARGVDITGAPV